MNNYGFIKNSNNFYYYSEENTIVINAQKSNNDNSYYINYGFYINPIHQEKKHPVISETDVRGRFNCLCIDNVKDRFILDQINTESLNKSLENNMNKIILPVIENGICQYFELFPAAVYTATLDLKRYLNM